MAIKTLILANLLRPVRLLLACILTILLTSCGDNGGSSTGGRVTYTVSGVISNLTADSLVLQLNGGNPLVLGAATSVFEFPVGLSDGQQYSITVKQSPPSETCSIQERASGTIAGANVVGVPIICTAKQFNVGGNITGLAGQGLLIEDQSSGVSTSPARGATSYTLSSYVSGQNYNLVVVNQPTNPTQTCSISSPAGQVQPPPAVSIANVTCTTQSYQVGGTVSGLLGNGLQLVDAVSGQTIQVPLGSSSFTFNEGFLSGASYQISVATQPTGTYTPNKPPTALNQTCTVASGGSATVESSAVTNIAVTCVTNRYGITGKIFCIYTGGPCSQTNAEDMTTGLILTETVTGTQATITGTNFVFPFPNGGIPDGSNFHINIQEQVSLYTNADSHCLLDSTGADGVIQGGDFNAGSVTCRFNSSGLAGISTGGVNGTISYLVFDTRSGRLETNGNTNITNVWAQAPTSDSKPISLVSGVSTIGVSVPSCPLSAGSCSLTTVYVANAVDNTITKLNLSYNLLNGTHFLSRQDTDLPLDFPPGAGVLKVDPSGQSLYLTSGTVSSQNTQAISSYTVDSSGDLTSSTETTISGFAGVPISTPILPIMTFNSTNHLAVLLSPERGCNGNLNSLEISLLGRQVGTGLLFQDDIASAISAGGISCGNPQSQTFVQPVAATFNDTTLYVIAETYGPNSSIGAGTYPIAAPSVIGYSLPSFSGSSFSSSALTTTPLSPYSVSNAPVDLGNALLLDPSNQYLFMVQSAGISAFSLNAQNGSLQEVPGSPFATVGVQGVSNRSNPIIDPSGRFLYALAQDTSNIVAYRINLQPTVTAPVLSLIGIYAVPEQTNNDYHQLRIDDSGKFLYVLLPGTSANQSQILGYFIDPNSGALSTTVGSPYMLACCMNDFITLPPFNAK